MAIVELKQPNYNATIEAIAQAVLASLRPGAATDKLLAVGAEMSTKLTTHIEDFERLANDVLLAVWDRLEAATSGEDVARLVNLTLEDVSRTVATMIKGYAALSTISQRRAKGYQSEWGEYCSASVIRRRNPADRASYAVHPKAVSRERVYEGAGWCKARLALC